MLNNSDFGHGPSSYARRFSSRLLGLAAAALLTLSIATSERAQAMSPVNPGAAAKTDVAADGLTIEVHGGHGGGFGGGHGFGGGGFHGGGFHGGGAALHGGGFRSGPAFHGGGFRYGGFHHGHRFAHRRFFAGGFYYDDYPYYDYPDYYSYPACRIVATAYGPRRICGYHHWRHHHYRRHHHRPHHRVYR